MPALFWSWIEALADHASPNGSTCGLSSISWINVHLQIFDIWRNVYLSDISWINVHLQIFEIWIRVYLADFSWINIYLQLFQIWISVYLSDISWIIGLKVVFFYLTRV